MMATKEDRFKAQEIELAIKQEMQERDEKRQLLKAKLSDLRQQADKKKQEARQKTVESADSNKSQMEAIDDLRDAAKLAAEANDLKHKVKDVEKQLEQFKRNVDFDIKQKAKEARKLKV